MIELSLVRIFVVLLFGVEPRKRRLEELDSSGPQSLLLEDSALAGAAKK